MAVVQMCEGAVDGVTVYNSEEGFDQEWSFTGPVTDFGSVTLTGLDKDLASGEPYYAFAGSNDNTASARGLPFKVGDLMELEPGHVLAFDPSVDDAMAVMTVKDFRDLVKSDFCVLFEDEK